MKIDRDSTKQILKIVIITIVLLAIVLNIEPVWNVCKVFFSIISPFIWGLAIAFILNIFMNFYENKLFNKKKKRNKKNKSTRNAHTVVSILIVRLLNIICISLSCAK